MPNDNTWNEWSKYVLKTLEEIKSEIAGIKIKMTCDVHKERMAGINGKIAWLWAMIFFLFCSIIGVAVKALAQ